MVFIAITRVSFYSPNNKFMFTSQKNDFVKLLNLNITFLCE